MRENVLSGPSWPEQVKLFEESKQVIRRVALDRRLDGEHHSGFLVGVGGLAMSPFGHKFCWGSNCKPEKGTHGPRVCAEEEMRAWALQKQCTHIVGFSIAAFFQPDDTEGVGMEGCLIPCVYCRRMFIRSQAEDGIFIPETICESMRLEDRQGKTVVAHIARMTLGELLERYPPPPLE